MLVMEAWRLFTARIEEREAQEGFDLGLVVRSEIRSFSRTDNGMDDQLLKPLSPELNEQDRLSTWKQLQSAPGGRTADHLPPQH